MASKQLARVGGSVLLVGFQDQDNLGLRYLMSAVRKAGHEASLLTYRSDPDPILARIREEEPDVVGFSLIFQYMAPDFGRVIQALRDAGVAAHFTMGGHYPSFDFTEILNRIPGLDSVVRYEGERTLIELLDKLVGHEDWTGLSGLAVRGSGGEPRSNPLRAPIHDLDTLPWPDRASIDYEGHPRPTASILASRGCPWNCSFCSIRPFYEAQGGSLRRLREPTAVVEEMAALYETRGVSIFLFQDDDFLATGRRARTWAEELADAVVERGLAGKIAFKISCRSDEIREDNMRKLMAAGLTHVYMGVESGDETSLRNMNKMLKPEAHLEAGRILKSLGLSFDFGFMLLEPYSTFETVRNNITFLEEFVGDGWTVVPFCRMLPYAGTPIRARLEAEDRLGGTPFEPDYNFLDPKLDLFYDWMLQTFYQRNFTSEGLCHILRVLLFEAHLEVDGRGPTPRSQQAYIHYLTAISNRTACRVLRSALDHIESAPLRTLRRDSEYLDMLTTVEHQEESRLLGELRGYRQAVQQDQAASSGSHGGGFDKSWTFNAGDREAAGVGAA